MTECSKLETVSRFFSGTGCSYDQVVTVCTAGFDRYWKRRILACIPEGVGRIVDQACGTGILTLDIARAFPQCHVTGIELRDEYLAIARKKAQRQGIRNVEFLLGRAEDVVAPGEQDCITSSYLAKYADLEALMKNCAGMLRPGGVMVLHDFTYPPNPAFLPLWHACFTLMRTVGERFFPEWHTVFAELPEFIQRSRWLPETVDSLKAHGFIDITSTSLTFGSAAIVTARKGEAAAHRTWR